MENSPFCVKGTVVATQFSEWPSDLVAYPVHIFLCFQELQFYRLLSRNNVFKYKRMLCLYGEDQDPILVKMGD